MAVTADNQPWWEGLMVGEPAIDWRGRPYDPANGPAAHPNSRFTVSARQCRSYSPHTEDPQGVPISAIVFGGRRASLVPLVFEARDWNHGVLVGAAMGSETTAAATGKVGIIRRDPMAMKPFCGYNFGDYWAHWLSFNREGAKLPRIFHVNWFRKDGDGKFLWPGFGDNLRVLEWMINRVKGDAGAVDTPIGLLPHHRDLNIDGLSIGHADVEQLLAIDEHAWHQEYRDIADYLDGFGGRTPELLRQECARIRGALAS